MYSERFINKFLYTKGVTFMKNLKNIVVGLLIISLLVPSLQPQIALAQEVNDAPQLQSEEEVTVISLVCEDLEIVEHTNGYDNNTGYGSYYYYNIYPSFTVTFSDGTTYEDQTYGVSHKGIYYSMYTSSNQSYETPWVAGNTYTAQATLGNVQADVNVTIKESPVVSVTCEPVEIIEYTNGYYTSGYDYETNTNVEYYYYYGMDPEFSVTFADGTVYNNQKNSVYYDGNWYYLSTNIEQNCTNPLTVGQHIGTATLAGVQTNFAVSIIETPIQKIEIEDVEIIENTGGYETSDYNDLTGQYESFYRYEPTIKKGKVFFKDGTVVNINDKYLYCDDYSFNITCETTQSVETPWGLGKHEVVAKVAGVETTYNMNIIKSPYVKIEVLDISTVVEGRNCRYEDGIAIYSLPAFTYKVTNQNGKSIMDYYQPNHYDYDPDPYLKVDDDQYENPWTVGTNNYFTLQYAGNLEIQVQVEVQEAPPFDYYEENGEIYITGYYGNNKILEIPSVIDNKPVVAIENLGEAMQFVTELTVPDSVRIIGESALQYYYGSSLQTVRIGSSVASISIDLFSNCSELVNISVSPNNPSYSSADGILYDKNQETVVAYPLGKEGTFVIPASVKNIDVMLYDAYRDVELVFTEAGTNFIEENDVIYNEDKTKVVMCAPEKTGDLVLPSTVTEISPYAFAFCEELTGVTIPNGVTQIAYCAFTNCTSLANVKLPSALQKIDGEAFSACIGLKSLTLPNGLKTIGRYAFYYSDIKSITIPSSVISIGNSAFAHSGLETVVIEDGVQRIEDFAFHGTNLASITIPDSVVYLGSSAFSESEELISAVIGSGVSEIAMETFSYCSNLKKVLFRNNEVIIGQGAFQLSPIEEVNLENVKKFDSHAFAGAKLKSIAIADGVTEITYAAFAGNKDLTSIDIPKSVTKIVPYAFDDTAWLDAQSEGLVYLEHALYMYKGSVLTPSTIQIKDGTTVIAGRAFEHQEKIQGVILPNGLKTIGDAAFYGCTGISEMFIPASVNSIEPNAFASCTSLTNITVDPDNPYYQSINGVLFNKDGTELVWCPKQVDGFYIVPQNVEVIKEGAFGSSEAEYIVIQNNETVLEKYSVGYSRSEYLLGGYDHALTTIVCDVDSLAYQYAKDNMIPVEQLAKSIEVKKAPDKLTYLEGKDALDVTGGVITLHYEDGTTSDMIMTNNMISGFDNSTPGSQLLTVTYQGRTTTFAVEIKAKEVTNISIETTPEKNLYVPEDTALDLTGGKLHVVYNNDTEAQVDITEEMISGFTPGQIGNQAITVTFGGKTSSFDVKVTDALIKADDVIGAIGNTIQVPIKMTHNPGINYLSLKIEYDSSALQLVSADNQGLLTNSMYQSSQYIDNNPYIMLWASAAQSANVGDVVILTFKVLENAVEGKYPITITCNEAYNQNNEDVIFDVISPIIDVREAEAGDTNADGEINGKDATLLLQYLAGWDVEVCSSAADVNGDGVVNGKDVTLLLKYLAGDDVVLGQ